MSTIFGTAGNDFWIVANPGTVTLDGLGGSDTLSLGTSLRSAYNITKTADGAIHVDSVSGASGAFHATLFNMEVLTFNSERDVLTLSTLFGGSTGSTGTTTTSAPAPTVTIVDNIPGVAIGNVSYALTFSTAINSLSAGAFSVSNGSITSITGTGASYTVVVTPSANTEGTLDLTLNAGAVTSTAGAVNAGATAAATQPIDTRAPTLASATPANQSAGVAAGSSIVLAFSEAIQQGTGSVTVKDGTGATFAVYDAATSSSLSFSGSTLTIRPGSALAAGTTYSVDISSGGLKDLAGNAFAGSTGYSFSTAVDTARPSLTGGPGNDSLPTVSGLESINGLGGTDTVVLAQARSAYNVAQTSGGWTVTAKDGSSTYSLSNVERLRFSDVGMSLDTASTQSGGQAVLLLGAVLGNDLLQLKKPLIGSVIGLLDQGFNMQQLSGALMRLDIWGLLANGGNPTATTTQIASYLLGTVNKVAPDAATLNAAVSALNAETPATQGTFLWQLALSSANQTQVGLVGLASTGVTFGG